MSNDNKAFIVVIALLLGALGVESAQRLAASAPQAPAPAPAAEHRLEK